MVLIKDKGTYGHEGKWLLLSKDKSRVLKIFGKKKPTKDEVRKEERRIQYFENRSSKPFTWVKSHKRGRTRVRAHKRRLR